MKRFAIIGFILASMLSPGGPVPAQGVAETPDLEKAVVKFQTRVKVADAVLQGDYLFVHDQNKMARGEPCTSIYEYIDGKQGRLVLSFHCVPVERHPVAHFSYTVQTIGPDLEQMKEFQFAGSTEGHGVPHAGQSINA